MTHKEITPYLNKIVRVYLKNRKRKIGWLVFDYYHEVSVGPMAELHCIKVRFGENNIQPNKNFDIKTLKQKSQIVKMEDIIGDENSLFIFPLKMEVGMM